MEKMKNMKHKKKVSNHVNAAQYLELVVAAHRQTVFGLCLRWKPLDITPH